MADLPVMLSALKDFSSIKFHQFLALFSLRRVARNSYLVSQEGLSLIEMLIVMALIGIICTIAVPSMPAMLRSYRLKAVATELASSIQLARLTAISQNANSVLTFAVANQSFSIFSDNGEGGGTLNDGVQSGSEPTIKTVNIRNAYYGEVTLNTPSFGNTTVFNSQGMCTPSGTISLQNSAGSTVQLLLSSGGSVKTLYP